MNILSAMAHNEQIYKGVEDGLNSLISAVTSEGGKIWIQSKSNKEHYFMLDDEFQICSYQPFSKE